MEEKCDSSVKFYDDTIGPLEAPYLHDFVELLAYLGWF